MRARVHGRHSRVLLGTLSAVALLFGIAWTSGVPAAAATTTKAATVTQIAKYHLAATGEQDCNGCGDD